MLHHIFNSNNTNHYHFRKSIPLIFVAFFPIFPPFSCEAIPKISITYVFAFQILLSMAFAEISSKIGSYFDLEVRLRRVDESILYAICHLFQVFDGCNNWLYLEFVVQFRLFVLQNMRQDEKEKTMERDQKKMSICQSHNQIIDEIISKCEAPHSKHDTSQFDCQQHYLEKITQFYRQVNTLKSKQSKKRIKAQIIQFLFFIFTQILIIFIKYAILNYHHSIYIDTYIEIFAIASLSAITYCLALTIFHLGILQFVTFLIHLDLPQLLLAVAIIASQYLFCEFSVDWKHRMALEVCYPIWMIYMGCSIRIQVCRYRYSRLQIVVSKMVIVLQFGLTLSTLMHYLSKQIYLQFSSTFNLQSMKYIIYLSFISHALYVGGCYRLYSQFDGTRQIRYDFLFQNSLQHKIRSQILSLKTRLLNDEGGPQYNRKHQNDKNGRI